MTHKYLANVDLLLFSVCERRAGFVTTFGKNVLVWCKVGHFIVGHVYESREKAEYVAHRLQRLIDF